MFQYDLLFDAIVGRLVIFHFCEGKAVFWVSVLFNHYALDISIFLEKFAKLFFDFFDIGLDRITVTSPSRLVMNSFVGFYLYSEGDLPLFGEGEELFDDMMNKYYSNQT